MEIIEKILDYLNNEQVSAKDVIILTLVSSILTGLLAVFWKKTWAVLHSGVKKSMFAVKEFYRKQVKVKLNLNELADIEEKVETNKQLKRYEKKAYEKHKAQLKIQHQHFVEKYHLTHLTEEDMGKFKNIKLKKQKAVYTPKGIYFVDDEEEHE